MLVSPRRRIYRHHITRPRLATLKGSKRRLETNIKKCINGYRQGSHGVINRGDSSNVLKHQVSLELQDIENHSQKGYQVTTPLQYKRTIEQMYYRTNLLSNQVSLQLRDNENHSQENTKSVYSFTITITIKTTN